MANHLPGHGPPGLPGGAPLSGHPFVPPPGLYPHMPPGLMPQPPLSAANRSAWGEFRSQDGRIYYYNSLTKQSSWEKPDELKTPAEKLMASCPWKEFKTEQGRVYYYNTQTSRSVWTKPPELEDAERQAAALNGSMMHSGTASPQPYSLGSPMLSSSSVDTAKPVEDVFKAALQSVNEGNAAELKNVLKTDMIPIPTSNKKASDNSSSGSESEDGNSDSVDHGRYADMEFNTREEKAEGFRQLLRDRKVPSQATWDTAVKLISSDPRYQKLKNFNEKKQIFNTYKTQRQKEEKEEQRLRLKKAKEDLEKLLLSSKKMSSIVRYRTACEELFVDDPIWKAVPDRERKEIFEDAIKVLVNRERIDAKNLRKRNIQVFNEILASLPKCTYKSTWADTQKMLLEHPRFAEDEDLQCMDKEDALICFEKYIMSLEGEHEKDREMEAVLEKRTFRKNREAFQVFLEELHENGKLNSLSLWKELFPLIKKDERFHSMLGQPGSTPLDLMKFYVFDLKAKLQGEREIIKEIVKDRCLEVEPDTPYETFLRVVLTDERGRSLDQGNIRLTYNYFQERALNREKERAKEESRKMKRLEADFHSMLNKATEPPVTSETTWETIRERFSEFPEFIAISLESERMRIFKDYLVSLVSAASNSTALSKDKKASSSPTSKKHRQHASSSSRKDSRSVSSTAGHTNLDAIHAYDDDDANASPASHVSSAAGHHYSDDSSSVMKSPLSDYDKQPAFDSNKRKLETYHSASVSPAGQMQDSYAHPFDDAAMSKERSSKKEKKTAKKSKKKKSKKSKKSKHAQDGDAVEEHSRDKRYKRTRDDSFSHHHDIGGSPPRSRGRYSSKVDKHRSPDSND